MKLTSFLIPLLLLTQASLHAQNATIHLPESNALLSIRLTAKEAQGDGYRAITLTTNRHTTRITPKSPVACIPAEHQARIATGLWAEPKGMQLDRSRCFFRDSYTANGVPHTLLVFLSEGYASNAAPILILGFHADGTPYKVLERDELDPFAFEPNPADGTALFIGSPTLSQVMNSNGDYAPTKPYATTYDPSAVYIIRPDAKAEYSLDQSRLYNQQHYVWAGPTSREDYAVVYNYPGRRKPFGIPAKQLEALFGKLPAEKPKP